MGYNFLIEDIVGKEEIARYKQFLLFPQCFLKLAVVGCVKRSIYGVKVKLPVSVKGPAGIVSHIQ